MTLDQQTVVAGVVALAAHLGDAREAVDCLEAAAIEPGRLGTRARWTVVEVCQGVRRELSELSEVTT